MDISIDRYLQRDRDSDLLTKLKFEDPIRAKNRIAVSGLAEVDYQKHEDFGIPVFHRTWHHSFPQELQDQFKHMQSNFATGLLPSILRAWMAIDSDLFLWNFENNRDLAFYDAINNTILNVDVVSPKVGFSQPQLHSILVVATTVDILLLGISFRDTSGKALSSDCTDLRNASAYLMGNAPLYKLPLDGLIINDICTTANGRIFFAADESLYELEYYDKTWYGGGGCKKMNHSKSLINYLVPVLSIFHTKDQIRQLAVDNSRNLLYVLFKKGSIQLFDMGEDGRSIQKFCVLHREEIEHVAKESCNVSAELFYEIVQITVVPVNQSVSVNLIAITSKGVRIFFTCHLNPLIPAVEQNLNQSQLRPTTFKIVHIRFPPGAPFVNSQNVNVYYTSISSDSILMASAETDTETALWALSSSCFALTKRFLEHTTLSKIRGNIWKIAKLRHLSLEPRKESRSLLSDDEHLILMQHLCPVEKFYILTSQGIYIFDHFSPLEMFRQILHNYGSDSKQFQFFASAVDITELCVMALIVLCSESSNDVEIKDFAQRIFFSYGGEPRLFFGSDMNQIPSQEDHRRNFASSSNWNSPNDNGFGALSPRVPIRTSTPHDGTNGTPNGRVTPGTLLQQSFTDDHSIVAGAQVQNSPRHEALFSYFSRIIKDIWTRKICFTKSNTVCSTLVAEEIAVVGRFLSALARAIDEYSLLSSSSPHHHHFHHILPLQSARQHSAENGNLIEQERQSLQKLRSMVGITCEVLALWGVLLEHELHVIFSMLPVDVQHNLLNWPLETLVRNRNEICAELITALIRFYIGDDATTTAISDRLRRLCPLLFTVDDASVVKATENIYRAKSSMDPKPELVRESVAALQKSIHKLNLLQTCDLLIQVLHFEGIVDLALTRAQKEDPSDLALTGYKRHVSSLDGAHDDAFRRRNSAYNCIIEVLKILHSIAVGRGQRQQQDALAAINLGSSAFPSAADAMRQLTPASAELERDKVIKRILTSDDELASVALFQWMISNKLSTFLIENKSKFFEDFLLHEIEEDKGVQYLELLWKYYEKNENYLEAAKRLFDMATKAAIRVSIAQRVNYLSHALICIQSAAETKSNLELKQDIQDKLDVAQIQMKTKAMIESSRNIDRGDARILLDILNYQLCDLTKLYRYAKQYHLAEIRLAVLHCAGKYEEDLVQDIWIELLDKELKEFQQSRASQEAAQRNIASTILRLSKRYAASPQYVPIDLILRELLVFCLKNSLQMDWLFSLCKCAEIPYPTLIKVFSDYRAMDPFWKQNQRAFQYIVDFAVHLAEKCQEEAGKLPNGERRTMKQICVGFLANLQLDIQLRGEDPLNARRRLEFLQAQIEQIL